VCWLASASRRRRRCAGWRGRRGGRVGASRRLARTDRRGCGRGNGEWGRGQGIRGSRQGGRPDGSGTRNGGLECRLGAVGGAAGGQDKHCQGQQHEQREAHLPAPQVQSFIFDPSSFIPHASIIPTFAWLSSWRELAHEARRGERLVSTRAAGARMLAPVSPWRLRRCSAAPCAWPAPRVRGAAHHPAAGAPPRRRRPLRRSPSGCHPRQG